MEQRRIKQNRRIFIGIGPRSGVGSLHHVAGHYTEWEDGACAIDLPDHLGSPKSRTVGAGPSGVSATRRGHCAARALTGETGPWPR